MHIFFANQSNRKVKWNKNILYKVEIEKGDMMFILYFILKSKRFWCKLLFMRNICNLQDLWYWKSIFWFLRKYNGCPKNTIVHGKSRKELILYSETKFVYALLKTLSICFSLNARPLHGEKLYSLVFLSMAINRMSSSHCKIYTQIWIELIGP